jgi:hypothetical protein
MNSYIPICFNVVDSVKSDQLTLNKSHKVYTLSIKAEMSQNCGNYQTFPQEYETVIPSTGSIKLELMSTSRERSRLQLYPKYIVRIYSAKREELARQVWEIPEFVEEIREWTVDTNASPLPLDCFSLLSVSPDVFYEVRHNVVYFQTDPTSPYTFRYRRGLTLNEIISNA